MISSPSCGGAKSKGIVLALNEVHAKKVETLVLSSKTTTGQE